MSEYTPTTNQIRTAWGLVKVPRPPGHVPDYGTHGQPDEFDRWLAEHDAALIEKMIAEIDKSPAVTWAGHGGAKERLRARAAELREAEG